MTVLSFSPKITSILFRGIDDLFLPFTAHVIDGALSDNPLIVNAGIQQKDKYYIKSVDGLAPPDRDVAIASTASGGKFQGVTVQDREIVVLIGLNPDYDAGETPALLRQNLETMLYTGYDPKVDIQFYAGIFPICHEYAYVSRFEASIFDANPAVQITFTCLNPTFRAFTPTEYEPSRLGEVRPDIFNYGTAETGFKFQVKFTDTMDGWFIKQADNQSVGMMFDKTFHDGDVLSVSTIPGQRYVHWNKHKGKVKNSLAILTGGSEWVQLHPGHNHFLVPKKVSRWNWQGNLVFRTRYAGF